jgi:hypothetical protein
MGTRMKSVLLVVWGSLGVTGTPGRSCRASPSERSLFLPRGIVQALAYRRPLPLRHLQYVNVVDFNI